MKIYYDSIFSMGTFLEIRAFGDDLIKLKKVVNEAFREVTRLEEQLSIYLPESDVSLINTYASQRPIKVERDLYNLINTAVRFNVLTSGAFDIAIEPVARLWKRSQKAPLHKEIDQAVTLVGSSINIKLDSKRQSVRFNKPGMKIDLGGVGKGFAVERIVEILTGYDLHNALINFGNSSIFALGAPQGEGYWTITIRHPLKQGHALFTLKLNNESVSTSSNYASCFELSQENQPHIVDPCSGYPPEKVLCATVVSSSALESEIFSTALYVSGFKKGQKILEGSGCTKAFIVEKLTNKDEINVQCFNSYECIM